MWLFETKDLSKDFKERIGKFFDRFQLQMFVVFYLKLIQASFLPDLDHTLS